MCMCYLKNQPTMHAVLFSVHSKKACIYRPCIHLQERAHNTFTVYPLKTQLIIYFIPDSVPRRGEFGH